MNYTFDTKWIQPFESAWCTTEKFKYANAINGDEYMSLLSITSRYYTDSSSTSLFSNLDTIEKLEKVLSNDFNNCHKTWIKMILGPLYCDKTFERYFATYLRYCPQCLSQGYHTPYTQLLWETQCPFHAIPIEDRVPSNRISDCRVPIGIHCRKEHSGFQLKCNESPILLSTYQIFKQWQTPLNVSLITNKLPLQGNYQYTLYYMPFSLVKFHYTLHYFKDKASLINKILSLKLSEFIKISSIIYPSNLLIPFIEPVNMTNIEDYLTKVYLTIYKSIAKYLRKQEKRILITLNALHAYKPMQYRESAIELVKKGILNQRVYAYILWSRDILGYDDYMQMTPHTLANTDNTSNSSFLKYLMYEVKQYFLSDYNMPIATLLVILQCTIPKIFWAQYKNYYTLAISALDVEGRRSINLNQKALGDMPLLVSYFDEDASTCYLLDSDYI